MLHERFAYLGSTFAVTILRVFRVDSRKIFGTHFCWFLSPRNKILRGACDHSLTYGSLDLEIFHWGLLQFWRWYITALTENWRRSKKASPMCPVMLNKTLFLMTRNHPPHPPQELNGRPLITVWYHSGCYYWWFQQMNYDNLKNVLRYTGAIKGHSHSAWRSNYTVCSTNADFLNAALFCVPDRLHGRCSFRSSGGYFLGKAQ